MCLSCANGATPPASPEAEAPTAPSAEPSKGSTAFKSAAVILYQPNEVLEQRLSGVEELGDFTKAVMAAAERAFPVGSAARELDIVMAIKPGRRARFWLVSPSPAETDASLLSQLQTIPAPTTRGGPVALAIIGSISDAPTSATAQPFRPPMPADWLEAARKAPDPVLVPDSFLDAVWPD